MLLNSMQVIPKSPPNEGSSLLRRKIEELNRNTVLLIAEVGKLIKGSEQLSDRLKSFDDLSTKRIQGSINPSQ
jgi:hypothetical protein